MRHHYRHSFQCVIQFLVLNYRKFRCHFVVATGFFQGSIASLVFWDAVHDVSTSVKIRFIHFICVQETEQFSFWKPLFGLRWAFVEVCCLDAQIGVEGYFIKSNRKRKMFQRNVKMMEWRRPVLNSVYCAVGQWDVPSYETFRRRTMR